MVISKYRFPFYGIIIIVSILIGMFYIYYNLKKSCQKNKQILLFFIIYIAFAFVCGKIYTVLAYGEKGFIQAGLSAYGGLIGVVIGAIIFEKILPAKGDIIKYTVLSLPLVYGLSKIACAIAGCCSGIPYEGFLKVKYSGMMDIWQFPVQIVESIAALIIFVICQKYSKKKNISYIVLALVAITKFSLDFLRYEHINVLITKNQVFSILLLLATIIAYVYNKKKD